MVVDVPPSTIVVWSDVGCPWAHLAVYRLHEARRRLGLEEQLVFEHLAFPLELFNDRPTPKNSIEQEAAALAECEPKAGWRPWSRREWEWPVTTLPALEAVRAAHRQSARAAERLDRALRVAFFGESRCISLRHVILKVAAGVDGLEVDALAEDLDRGVARHRMIEEWFRAVADDVSGSPHLFLPDGTDVHNPGIAMHWDGKPGSGTVVIEKADPTVYDDLVQRAAASG